MKTPARIVFVALGAAGLFAFTGAGHQANYVIAPGHEVKISGADVEATFDSLSGNIRFAPEHLDNVLFDATVSALSINTGIELKDKHAKSAGWLDAEGFPAIRFRSTVARQTATGFSTSGELELHGIKQAVEIPFNFDGKTFTGAFDIKRNDFKIGKPKSKVAPEIHVSLRVPVVPAH